MKKLLSLFTLSLILCSCEKSLSYEERTQKIMQTYAEQTNSYKNKCLKSHHELCCDNLVFRIKDNVKMQIRANSSSQLIETSYEGAVSTAISSFTCSFSKSANITQQESSSDSGSIGVLDGVKIGIGAEIGRQLMK